MALDLKNLTDDLKFGKVLDDRNKRITILTPVFRAMFTESLAKPQSFRGGDPRFTIYAVFNGTKGEDAHVDLKKVFLPAIKKVATENTLNIDPVSCFSKGIRHKKDGTPYTGFDENSMHVQFAKYPNARNPNVPCYSPLGRPDFDPAEIYGGCYARARVQLYKPKSWDVVSFGLISVQMLAHGEPFGSSIDPTMEPVEGAEDINSGIDSAEPDFSSW